MFPEYHIWEETLRNELLSALNHEEPLLVQQFQSLELMGHQQSTRECIYISMHTHARAHTHGGLKDITPYCISVLATKTCWYNWLNPVCAWTDLVCSTMYMHHDIYIYHIYNVILCTYIAYTRSYRIYTCTCIVHGYYVLYAYTTTVYDTTQYSPEPPL